MMIAARWRVAIFFLVGIFLVGDFGSTRSSSERLGALGFLFEGICGGILFWGGGGGRFGL